MVRLIVYNIQYCAGDTGHIWEYFKFWTYLHPKPKLEADMIEFIRHQHPDILALVEIDCGSIRNHFLDKAKFWKKKLHYRSMDEGHNYSLTGWKRWLYYAPYLRKQSNALMAKYELTDIKHHFLSKGFKNVVIEATIRCPKKLTLLLTHLSLGRAARTVQIKEISEIINNIKNPVIVMGDLNTFQGRHELDQLINSTKLQPVQLHKDNNFTFPAYHPTIRLDYILASKKIKIKSYKVLKTDFSDHLPVMVDFSFRK
ncbi:endonuclease/exonuclease/phosphatase family protein [Nanoarchaeota archaeon]